MKAKNRLIALRWMGMVAFFLVAVAGARATVEATGGDYTYDKMIDGSRYRLHVFTNAGPSTLTVTQGGEVEYLVVGGGGAGGYGSYGAGGGGGAVLSNAGDDKFIATPQTYAVHVGTGGIGKVSSRGGTGDTSFFADIEAPGGGGGGTTAGAVQSPGGTGSSGGGGAGYYFTDSLSGRKGLGTPGLGYDGGDGYWVTNIYSGGGGGGAGAPGMGGAKNAGGDGGNGVPNFITGVEMWYGGGGAGSCIGTGTTGGVGGLGGGADGLDANGTGLGGEPNTGGGGSAGNSGRGGHGGSGVVIIRYIVPTSRYTEATGGDVVYERTIDDTRYRIHVFTNVGPSTLTFTQIGEVEYLVVGGGGGGGGFGINHGSGGGGGGAVLSNVGGDKLLVTPQAYAVQVGTGALAKADQGGSGTESVFFSVVAPGGGGGGGEEVQTNTAALLAVPAAAVPVHLMTRTGRTVASAGRVLPVSGMMAAKAIGRRIPGAAAVAVVPVRRGLTGSPILPVMAARG